MNIETFASWDEAGIVLLPLTKGFTAVIDADDAERVGPLKWQAHTVRRSRTVYASRATTKEERAAGWPKRVLLHRLIMGDPFGPDVDHVDGDGLNCRKSNLRHVTHSLNNRNVPAKSLSGRVGVNFDKSRGKWRAYAKLNGKTITIGRFNDLDDAIAAREAFEQDHFPEVVFRWSVDHVS